MEKNRKIFSFKPPIYSSDRVDMRFFLFIFFSFNVCANVADIEIKNKTKDKSLSHKALEHNVMGDFRKASKEMRIELKRYRQQIYDLQKQRETSLETAKALINEAKALKIELQADLKKRKELKEELETTSSGVASFASQVVLGGDITDRKGTKQELAQLEQIIKTKKQMIRLQKAKAKELIRKRKVMKQEIAELREEMGFLKEERKEFHKRGLANK